MSPMPQYHSTIVGRRLVAYMRVSTEEQASGGVSLAAQRSQIAAYATALQLECVAFETDVASGALKCHGSAYENRVRSAKRIHPGSAKQSHLRSAKRIHLAGVETGQNGGPDRPSGSTRDRALEPVMDGGDRGRGRSGRRRPGPTDERAEDGYASTAGAGATAPTGADGAASSEGAAHRTEHSEGVPSCTQRSRSAGGQRGRVADARSAESDCGEGVAATASATTGIEARRVATGGGSTARAATRSSGHSRSSAARAPRLPGQHRRIEANGPPDPPQPWSTPRGCDDSGRHGAGRRCASGLRIRGKAVGFDDRDAAQSLGFRNGAGVQPPSVLRSGFRPAHDDVAGAASASVCLVWRRAARGRTGQPEGGGDSCSVWRERFAGAEPQLPRDRTALPLPRRPCAAARTQEERESRVGCEVREEQLPPRPPRARRVGG